MITFSQELILEKFGIPNTAKRSRPYSPTLPKATLGRASFINGATLSGLRD